MAFQRLLGKQVSLLGTHENSSLFKCVVMHLAQTGRTSECLTRLSQFNTFVVLSVYFVCFILSVTAKFVIRSHLCSEAAERHHVAEKLLARTRFISALLTLQARSTQVASGDTMRKDCARLIYYSCFFIACFACLGTFASFLLGKSTESLNHEANEYVKILCPSVLVLSFVVMWLVRCSTKKSRNSTVQQTIPYGVNQPVAGNNPAYLCDDSKYIVSFGLGSRVGLGCDPPQKIKLILIY